MVHFFMQTWNRICSLYSESSLTIHDLVWLWDHTPIHLYFQWLMSSFLPPKAIVVLKAYSSSELFTATNTISATRLDTLEELSNNNNIRSYRFKKLKIILVPDWKLLSDLHDESSIMVLGVWKCRIEVWIYSVNRF